jgi:DNA-binding NtrC family response regulator
VAGQKILVIDDSKVIRVRVREMLPPGNFDVLEAKDGRQGLDLIHKEKPSLIMLDFLLPKLSGWEVFQQIQVNDELLKIPLVLMSGRKEEVTEKIPEPFKYFEFIEKPFEKQQLIGAIKSAFQKSKIPRPTQDTKPEPAPTGSEETAATAELEALKKQMAKMQAEINQLKKYAVQFNAVKKQVVQLKAIIVKQRQRRSK